MYSYRVYRLIILAAIMVALFGKAQSCKIDLSIPDPYSLTLQCVVVELNSSKFNDSVRNFSNVTGELVNQLPHPNSPDYTAFEFVSSNVNDTSISLFLHFHRKTYKM